MRNKTLWIVVLAALFGPAIHAQDISGDWQGTLKADTADLRAIIKIVKGDDLPWKATLFSIDASSFDQGFPFDSVTLQGSTLKLAISRFSASYEGRVSADGTSIEGVWTGGQKSWPLQLKRATADTAWKDLSAHTVRFVSVDKDVKLQVLDWGGSGRPLVLLAGLGNDAHVYDKFAPKLTGAYHVYCITRRGFGASSARENYAADRLGDDVLAVIGSLKLSRPVLVGHSIAGEELSSVGSRHPEKVAGLINLDAGYPYAYYDRSRGDVFVDSAEVRRKLDLLDPVDRDNNSRGILRELAETDLPALEKAMRRLLAVFQAESTQSQFHLPLYQAIFAGYRRYIDIRAPILAIFAFPSAKAEDAEMLEIRGAQAKAFETGLSNARVVRLENAAHDVFRSNEADVLREMNAFIGSLP